MTCRTCAFAKDRDKAAGSAVCHRYPPHTLLGFPIVSFTTWCGEYIDKNAPEPVVAPLMAAMEPEPVEPVRVNAARQTWREWMGI